MTTENYTAQIYNNQDLVINGMIYSSTRSGGNLTKMGPGNLTLRQPYYTGVTTITDGTLNLSGNTLYSKGVSMVAGSLENGTLTTDPGISSEIKASGGNLGVNLSGGMALTLDSVTNIVVRLSGTNDFNGLIKIGATNNQTLELAGVLALSPNASLSGSSSFGNTPTLSLMANGEYQADKYLDGNIIFNGANAGTSTLTFKNASGSTVSGGSKALTASNVSVIFDGSIDLAASQAIKKVTLNGNGNFTLNGEVFNSSNANSAGLVKANSGFLTLGAVNTYNGPTDIQSGTMIVQAKAALPTNSVVTVSNGATLTFLKSLGVINLSQLTLAGALEQNLVTIANSGAVSFFDGSTLKVNQMPTASSYTLVTGTSVTGTPTLNPAIQGYSLAVSGNSLLLQKDKIVPQITVTPDAGGYIYSGSGQGPGVFQVNKGGSAGAVTLSYVGSGATSYGPLPTPPTLPGTYAVTASLAADGDYAAASAQAAFTIYKATSTVSVTGLVNFTYNGTPQGPASNSKTGSTGAVTYSYKGSGSTSYAPSSTKPTAAGSYTVAATLVADGNYDSATSSDYPFTIAKASPTITQPPTASDITSGQTLLSSRLNGGTASVSGTFAFTNPSRIPAVGTSSQSVTFTPSDSANYDTATSSVSVKVNPAGSTYKTWLGSIPATDQNLLEYAFGADAPGHLDPSLKPTSTVNENGELVLTYYVRQGALNLSVVPQVAAVLVDRTTGWATTGISDRPVGSPAAVNGISVQKRQASVSTSVDHQFIQLKVSDTNP